MLLPHAERAEVDLRKLTDYCLNPEHWEGKHKARLFAAALGITADDAPDFARRAVGNNFDARCAIGIARRIRSTLYSGLLVGMAREAGNDSEWLDN